MPKTPKFFSNLTRGKAKTITPISTHPEFYRPKGSRFKRKGRTRIRTMRSIARDYFRRMDNNLKGKFFGNPSSKTPNRGSYKARWE